MRTYVAKKVIVRKIDGMLWLVKGEGFVSFEKTYVATASGLPLLEVQTRFENGKVFYSVYLKDNKGNAHRKFVAEEIDIQV